MYEITLCSVLIEHTYSNTTEREGLGEQMTSLWKQTDFICSLLDTHDYHVFVFPPKCSEAGHRHSVKVSFQTGILPHNTSGTRV